MQYATHVSARTTHQDQPIFGRDQVVNSAGGYGFAINDRKRLDRFLILGTEGGTYYASERQLTIENAEALLRLVRTEGVWTVGRIVEISRSGRAPKNDAALFALAVAAGMGNEETRRAALNALPDVARIGTHLFTFLENVKQFRGWGRGLRRAVGLWYGRDVDHVALQMMKYRQRNGWTHRDVLRLAHVNPATDAHNALLRYAVDPDNPGPRAVLRNKATTQYPGVDVGLLPDIVSDYVALSEAKSASEVVRVIARNPRVTWEMVPTALLGEAGIWEALLPSMPAAALVRNLARMTANGLVAPMSNASRTVVERLGNAGFITNARLHPVSVLTALGTYQLGHGHKGSMCWEPVAQVIDALDRAFYLAFGNVTPTGKRTMLSLDLSHSMANGQIAGSPGLTPRKGAAAMSLVTANVEPNYLITGFTAHGRDPVAFSGKSREGMDLAVSAIDISPRQRLEDAVAHTESFGKRRAFGGTDCALPMLYALKRGIAIDVFAIYTDSETWAGSIHPTQALEQYRRETGIPAKLVVVGMTATGFSIADQNDSGQLDVVGFDTATPELISDFATS